MIYYEAGAILYHTTISGFFHIGCGGILKWPFGERLRRVMVEAYYTGGKFSLYQKDKPNATCLKCGAKGPGISIR